MKKLLIIFISIFLMCLLVSCRSEDKDNTAPYIQDGYWYIDGTNTGIKAEGVDGTAQGSAVIRLRSLFSIL